MAIARNPRTGELTRPSPKRKVVVKKAPTPKQAETDPNGLAADAGGAKLDAGKIRVSLVLDGFPRALEQVAKVGTYGANKYSDNGWMQVPDGIRRYKDAMGRHRLADAKGERYCQETGLLHSAQEAWNTLAKLELELRAAETEGEI